MASCIQVGRSYEKEMRNSPIDAVSAKGKMVAAPAGPGPGKLVWVVALRPHSNDRFADRPGDLGCGMASRQTGWWKGGKLAIARWIERRSRRGGGADRDSGGQGT